MPFSNPNQSKLTSSSDKKKILVTTALPYANGPIHLGHMLEHIQADVWTRTKKMFGKEVIFLCAEDAHGTAIMLRAEKERRTPEALITESREEHLQDFKAFSIDFDNYYTTHSTENRKLVEMYYERLNKAKLIEVRTIEQAFDPIKLLFLADRFIKGECPKCNASEQYGDSCEACGSTYSPKDMRHAYSIFSNAPPIWKKTQHYFFKLSDPRCLNMLQKWVGNLKQIEIKNKLQEWLDTDASGKTKLEDWDISRDAPYFGFEIPDAPGKFFYVWLDAPIGYFASLQNLCERKKWNFDSWIHPESDVEQYHFIGKDILYFHTLFWPAMCFGANLRLPTNVYAHGFLTIEGKKMSKSRGTFVTARSYINSGLDPDALRYYFCSKINGTISDIDLNFSDFIDKINSDLVGKYVNIASRSSKFLTSYFKGQIHECINNSNFLKKIQLTCARVSEHFLELEYSQAIKEIMSTSDDVNAFIDKEKPWILAKTVFENTQDSENLHKIVSISIEAFRLISIMLKPITPTLVGKAEKFLQIQSLSWMSANTPLPSGHKIKPYEHLMKRITKQDVESLIQKK